MSAERKCIEICDEIVDCSKCEDELCEELCDELEDLCLSKCLEYLK